MKKDTYMKLYRKLNTLEDVDRLSKNTKYNRELLFVLYTQKIVRQATRRFYKVKSELVTRLTAHTNVWRSIQFPQNAAFPRKYYNIS